MRLRFAAALAAFGVALAGQALAGDISPEANREYIAANIKKPGVVILPSGLQYRVIEAGAGATPTAEDTVTVSYKGTRVDGVVFDQTKPGETRNLPVNRVIPGWQEALSLMKEGDHWEIVIPSALGYGAARSDAMPSNQVLTFDMHLIAVLPAKR